MMKLNMIQMKKVFLPVLLLVGLAGSTGVRAEVPAGGSSIPGSNVAVGLSGEVVKGTCSVIVESGQNLYFGRFLINDSNDLNLGEKATSFTLKGCQGQKVGLKVMESDIYSRIDPYSAYMNNDLCGYAAGNITCPMKYSLTLDDHGKLTPLPLFDDKGKVTITPDSVLYPISIKVKLSLTTKHFMDLVFSQNGLSTGSYTYDFTYD
ncbi:hypothetical protein AADY61_004217 [Salmonella enterica]